MYLAGGCAPNGLLSLYKNCGKTGFDKRQDTSLGRKPILSKAGINTHASFKMTLYAKQCCFDTMRLIRHGLTLGDAFHAHNNIHYSDIVYSNRGEPEPKIFPKECRPSFDQFMYWGLKYSKHDTAAKLRADFLGINQWHSRGGSEKENVFLVGTRGSIDGTSTDVNLVTITSRLKKLPPAKRMILRETRLNLIVGWYIGWEPPSERTVLQTIFMGAQCKVQLYKRFDLNFPSEGHVSMLMHKIDADNGEAKTAKLFQAEQTFGFSIQYKEPYSGASKPTIESGHHADHKKLDHKLTGTNFGKISTPGREKPVDNAVLNYYEYMREFLTYVYEHNNEEVPSLRPIDMLCDAPKILPTRINIYRWLQANGMSDDLSFNPEAMRAFMLPEYSATLNKEGIFIHADVLGYKVLLDHIRYMATDALSLKLLTGARETGKSLPVKVLMDPSDLSITWLPTKDGLIPWRLIQPQATVKNKFTLEEVITIKSGEMIAKKMAAEEADQRAAATVNRQLVVTENAMAEQKAEAKALENPPSKAEMRKARKQNAKEESAFLDDKGLDGLPRINRKPPKPQISTQNASNPILVPLLIPSPLPYVSAKELVRQHKARIKEG